MPQAETHASEPQTQGPGPCSIKGKAQYRKKTMQEQPGGRYLHTIKEKRTRRRAGCRIKRRYNVLPKPAPVQSTHRERTGAVYRLSNLPFTQENPTLLPASEDRNIGHAHTVATQGSNQVAQKELFQMPGHRPGKNVFLNCPRPQYVRATPTLPSPAHTLCHAWMRHKLSRAVCPPRQILFGIFRRML